MERITKEQARKLSLRYLTEKGNNVYPFLYEPLKWRHESWQELSPEQVWQEAITLSDRIRQVNVPKFEMPIIIEELKEQTAGERNADFLILLSAVYRLAPLTVTDDKVKKATAYAVAVLRENPLYEVMKQRVSVSENDEDLLEYRVNILEYQLTQLESCEDAPTGLEVINELVDNALLYSPDDLKSVVLLVLGINIKHRGIYSSQLEKLLDGIKTKSHNLYEIAKKIEHYYENGSTHEDKSKNLNLPVMKEIEKLLEAKV